MSATESRLSLSVRAAVAFQHGFEMGAKMTDKEPPFIGPDAEHMRAGFAAGRRAALRAKSDYLNGLRVPAGEVRQ